MTANPYPASLGAAMLSALTTGNQISCPSSQNPSFDLNAAYEIERAIVGLRRQEGRKTTGLKVGYANKAVWRVLKLETLVWAHMYDDTVHYAPSGEAHLQLPFYHAIKIEPEIVFHLKHSIARRLDAAAALQAVDWLALGFELIHSPFPGWQFKPADFVAAAGLHAGLVIAEPRLLDTTDIPQLIEQLATFKVRVTRNGEFVEEGAGKNSLRSPALCLAELASATAIKPGDLVSTGSLTAGHLVSRNESWKVEADGLELRALTLQLA
jgi:2-oxo-3-hexenedioate decarboxylase